MIMACDECCSILYYENSYDSILTLSTQKRIVDTSLLNNPTIKQKCQLVKFLKKLFHITKAFASILRLKEAVKYFFHSGNFYRL